ncbi:hypothetical protein IW261DRAFT_1438999 [Armillaria novae-zelandiae]|uniref:F-box domain-containing protein n=1 Tax=Armillaria novae-zelandiae TaxID=153914 RepID=A0AA39PWZ0_9AGAR|nr:hypothetical protein IW261DRAFT_1438999 [Armillaria novae-zelandiae]
MAGKRKSRSRGNSSRHIVLCDQCQHAFRPSDTCPPTSFAEQCRVFYIPSNRQRKKIFHEQSRLEKVAADYDHELTRLRDIVAQLESQRADVQTHIDICTSLISAPMRRLRNPPLQTNDLSTLSFKRSDPDKILKLIFIFACYRDNDNDDSNSHLRWLTPLVMSHVCSYWRKLSLGIPEMWSCLDVSRDLRPESNMELLHTYIARTNVNTPLSVRVELDMHCSFVRRHALNLILGHAGRWKEAIIIIDHQLLYQFLPCPFDILESLVLRIGNVQDHHSIEHFKSVPRLRYVVTDAALSALSFPYSVRCIDLSEKVDNSAIVRIEDYQLDAPNIHLSLFPIFRDACVQLTNLRALTLHALPSDFETFAQTVTIPYLDRLSIAFSENYTFDVSSFHSLLSLIKRSKCHLSAFSLDMTQCPGDHCSSHIQKLQSGDIVLWDFLVGIPSITELRVIEPRSSKCVHCNMVTMLLRWLVVTDVAEVHSTPLILPYLRILQLVWTASPDVNSLKTMVDSRAEERTVVGGNVTPVDVEAEEENKSLNEVDDCEETSRSDTSFETCRSSECNDDNDVVVSALESLVIGTRAEIDVNSDMMDWMNDLRVRGLMVHLW